MNASLEHFKAFLFTVFKETQKNICKLFTPAILYKAIILIFYSSYLN